MPTWCHMFNSTLTGNARVWFDGLLAESIDNYDDLKKAFLENYLQQKKCIKDPIEICNIKQQDGESTEDFVKRYKLESRGVKGAPKCMRIFGFVHGITNPELIKRLHDKIPKTVDEMMRVTTSFLRGEVAASNHEWKKSFPPWKQQEVGHNTDECMDLKKQIEEMLKAGKLSHLIKELKQNNGKEQPKAAKKGETSGKDKALAILMNHWKTKSQKIISGFVDSSRNAKVPSGRRSNYSKKQQVGPAGMCDGLRTRREPFGYHASSRRKNQVAINPEYLEQTVMIGSTLTEEGRNKLCRLLQRNLDIFASKPTDMTDVPRHIAEHCLNVREGCSPVRQKKRGQAADRN
ncbi:reverse transcriptase domain-containing protein [Tanacetum coccineum]